MSNDLSFDGDSDGISESFQPQIDDAFSFDVSSHILPKPAPSEKRHDVEMKSSMPGEVDLSTIQCLHEQVSELLSPKNEEASQSEGEDSHDIPDSAEKDADNRSIYIGNVDYSSTVQDLSSHFSSCGNINRITIGSHKATGRPKGYAYIEFADRSSVMSAMALNETLFKGRLLKICPKRTNIPGLSASRGTHTRGRGRGRGGIFKVSRRPIRRGRGRASYRYNFQIK
ncbi:Embryonic polyadenylate-binding protein 2-B [Thelohanellus kitauei]|uniref:Embryonic polyadenylate-binding protein 2-B n=1 Tax=Thelohanellus kitauei TaxID=669202 RepID=A0A0C2MQN7_THEKT|nr:Embryonic polyadenylate-binding protein 2-B [Thelohanellus kitauei]